MKLTGTWRAALALAAVIAMVAVTVGILVATPDRGSDEESERVPERAPESGSTDVPGAVEGRPAPELVGLLAWINSEPLTLESLRGNVVLIDFWTYTCINCIRTFPFLKAWHEKYADKGLVILGIHSPEFEFEKKLENVEAAAVRHGLEYPIALDSDHATWTAYRNSWWPRKYLVDQDGVVRYDHIGEGAYEETEGWIKRLLEEAGASVDGVESVMDPERLPTNRFGRVTPELYAGTRGYFNGHIGNVNEYQPLKDAEYALPDSPRSDAIYLKGLWRAEREFIRHARETADFQDALVLRYRAASVNLVIRPEEGTEPFDLLILLDGEPLNGLDTGDDVTIGEDGQSFVRVDSPRMYSLVGSPEVARHELTIAAKSDAFAFYAFTFGQE